MDLESLVQAFESNGVKVLKPGDKDYEYAVATENLMFRYARPAGVVQPRNTAQVQAVIREAKARKRRLTIKNGGHSYAGASTTDRGILLDLSKMKGISLDAKAEEVTLQGGARWGHAYKALIDADLDGWVINGGRCPMVGVSGFILGGGLSPFTRSFGMGCDTLLEATLVTADGNKVAVTSKDDQKSDNGKLFWALCGAGGGNFGVVVEMKMKLQKLEGREVVAGLYVWAPKPDADAMKNFMSTMVDFYTAKWPTQTTIDSSWLCALDDAKSELKVRFPIYHNGDKAKFDATIDKHIKNRELAKQLKLRSAAEPSTRFLLETLVSQWSFENKSTLSSATGKFRIYTSVALDNNKTTIVGVTNLIRKEMAVFRDRFTGEDGLMQVTWIHAGGRANRGKNSTTTAFPWRTCVYHTYVMLEWKEKWLNADMEGFLKRMRTELRKFAIESRASFINFPDRGLKKGYEEAYFGVNTEALREIKEKWDPDNFFKWSQGVKLPKKSNNKPPRIMRAAPRIAPGEEGDAVATFSVFVVDRAVDEGKSEEEEEEQEKDEYIVDDMVLGAAAVRNKYEGGGVLSLLDLGF